MAPTQKQTPSPQPGCIFAGCHRPRYARSLCQTHHRQLLTTGKLKAIRPYRVREKGTVKFSGLRLSPRCAALLAEQANQRGISFGAAIAEILGAPPHQEQGHPEEQVNPAAHGAPSGDSDP